MTQTVIIVAGGKGERMKSDLPKQFLEIHSRPVLMHTIEVFRKYNNNINIIVVLPENQLANWAALCKKHAFDIAHSVVAGGQTRFESVKNGLAIAGNAGLIAVHDGVRPLVNTETISRCFEMAALQGAAIPVINPVESIRQLTVDGSISVDRTQYKLVQTPQIFQAEIIQKAYLQDYSPQFTDDASVVEKAGHLIYLVEGNPENIKITTPPDLLLAELLL
jgi:2-C-methyl-D-erythritol 4-phosphate cytidylyltransferase